MAIKVVFLLTSYVFSNTGNIDQKVFLLAEKKDSKILWQFNEYKAILILFHVTISLLNVFIRFKCIKCNVAIDLINRKRKTYARNLDR